MNPPATGLNDLSDLDLIVAGTQNAVLMVESEARQLSEEIMLGAVLFGHEQLQVAINEIRELAAQVNKKPMDWQAPDTDTELAAALSAQAEVMLGEAYSVADKMERYAKIDSAIAQTVEALCSGDDSRWDEPAVKAGLDAVKKKIVRGRILAGEPRIDGRDSKTVRPIAVRTGVLPRTHGSALFTRGETQALVVTTLGTERDSQIIDALEGERREHFMLHYNFPPFCVGETGQGRLTQTARDRARSSGKTWSLGVHARHGKFPVLDPRRV